MKRHLQRVILTLIAVIFTTVSTTSFARAADNSCSDNQFYSDNDVLFYCSDFVTCEAGPTIRAPQTEDLKSFIKVFAKYAVNVQKKYGIPYEAILAQGSLESANGKSSLASKYNNFFGIKAGSGWNGNVINLPTDEVVNGQTIHTTAAFRVFPDPQSGWNGYGEFITGNSRYSEALNYPHDPYRYIQEIKNAGYATDPAYVSKLSGIIKAIQDYIKSENLFPPSSDVPIDTAPDISSNNATTQASTTGCTAVSSAPSQSMAKVIQIAQTELAKNVVEYDQNVLKYTTGRHEAWCADFVSWVYKEAGLPFTGGGDGGWQIPGVLSMQSWFKQNGTYFEVGKQKPQPGDVAFYIGAQTPDGNSTEHVNIVISVEGNNMTVIGGNQGNRVSSRTMSITAGNQSLVGFGRMTNGS